MTGLIYNQRVQIVGVDIIGDNTYITYIYSDSLKILNIQVPYNPDIADFISMSASDSSLYVSYIDYTGNILVKYYSLVTYPLVIWTTELLPYSKSELPKIIKTAESIIEQEVFLNRKRDIHKVVPQKKIRFEIQEFMKRKVLGI